jgi:Flp pilus assembly pilin Flp
MRRMKRRLLKGFLRGETGASFTEYGLLLVLVVLAAGASALTLGDDIVTFLNNIGTEVSGASVPDVP